MKKKLFIVLLVLSMLMAFAGTAYAAPLAEGTATLVSAEYGQSGSVFIFSVTGKFSKAELTGTLQVDGGDDYPLYCSQLDEFTVRCLSSEKVGGQNVVLAWGGFVFWASVPAAPPPPEYCYNVYDFDLNLNWKSYGTHCQDTPAQYGDTIPWYNPDWDDYYDAIFAPFGPICSGIFEDAYYYDCGI